ncbi:MAG: ADOP family duplicated permease [Gemmatimonadota bacterium]|nr:ADOP family duplicated permease [Gemmatimonadota bacterium]
MTQLSDRYAELHALLSRSRLEREVIEELELHFDSLVERYRDEGFAEDEARSAALERFGDIERVRHETAAVDRRSNRRSELSEIAHDATRALRLAVRRLRRRPEFSLFALLTLTVAIAAFSALFTVLERLVLSPLPFDEAGDLVRIESGVPGVGPDAVWGLSQAGYFDFLDNASTLSSLGAFSVGGSNLTSDAGPARVRAAAVTATLLETLRLRAVVGRLLGPDDDVPGGPAVVMLDHAFWQTRFGADAEVIGTTIELDGSPSEIIGVLERGHGLPDRPADVWRPLQLDRAARPVNAHWVSAIGRLSETTADAAQSELDGRTAGFVERFPSAYSDGFMRESGFRTIVTPLKDYVLGDSSRTIWILFSAAGLLLLIALANVTNLYLVRTSARRRDFQVRTALGASRRHLTWQCLTETLILGAIAAVVAIPLARVGIQLLLASAPPGLPRLVELDLGRATVLFTLGVGLAMGIFLGLVPLMARTFESGGGVARHSGARATISRSGRRARQVMLASQMAVALVLLAAGGLMLRSLTQLRAMESGFEDERVLSLDVFIPWSSYSGYVPVSQFYRQLLDRLEALPGVERAGATTRLPMIDVGFCSAMFFEDQPLGEGEVPPCLPVALASPGFFDVLGIPVDGETPTWADVDSGSGSVVVTQALADRIWPGEAAIGKGVRGNGWAQPFYRVRGVARDFLSDGFDRPPIEGVFFPMRPIDGAPLWSAPNAMRVVIRTTNDASTIIPAVRSTIRDLDRNVPLANVRELRDAIWSSPSVSRTSFSLLLLGVAAGLALLLSTVGMYGVVSQLVVERSGEIAVRLALGARLREVIAMVMSQSMRVALVGVGIGVAGALAAGRALDAVLFGVDPADPLTFGAATVTLLGTVALATYLAARRAGRVDPIDTLRAE